MAFLSQNHWQRVTDAIDLEGNAQASFATSTSAAQSAVLAEGVYDVWTETACFLKVDPVANDVTASTGYQLLANVVITVIVRAGSKIGAITASGTGTLRYHKVD